MGPGSPSIPLGFHTDIACLGRALSHHAESKVPPSLAPWLGLQRCQPASVSLLPPRAAALPFVTQEVGSSGATSWRREMDQEGLTLEMLTWGTSLVVQWLRISLPIQGIQVRPSVWEDPTCLGATKPACSNY